MKLTEKEVREALGVHYERSRMLHYDDVDEVVARMKIAGLILEQLYIVRIPDANDSYMYWNEETGWLESKLSAKKFTMKEIKKHPVISKFSEFAVEVDE